MSKRAMALVLVSAALFGSGCAAEDPLGNSCEVTEVAFAPDPDDEGFDTDDPPTDPDPIGDEEEAAAAVADALDEEAGDGDDRRDPAADDAAWDGAEDAGYESDSWRESIGCRSEAVKNKKDKGKKKKDKKDGKGKKDEKTGGGDGEAPSCPARGEELSPKGLTFVIHFSKHKGDVALKQLKAVRHLIRPRDIFVIEQKEEASQKLRKAFPCNEIHFIAYPDEFQNAVDAGDLIDGISIDWEGGKVFGHSQDWSAQQLETWAKKIRNVGKKPSFVPYWPGSFNDGAITKKSKMGFELAQIQNRCAQVGPGAFASAAKSLIDNFKAQGLGPKDIGFEISLNSFADAPNHTGVADSVECTRKAYGKGARAIYLYGNGQPHLDDYFKKIAKIGLRTAQ